MKSLIPLALVFMVLAGCTHRVTRIGYAPGPLPADCNPAIKRMASFNDVPVRKIGSIKLGDTGFSTECEETDAIRILKQEACAAGADIVNIIEEKRADLISSCYRVEADFLKISDTTLGAKVVSDEEFQDIAIEYRKGVDQDRKTGMIIGSIVGGIVGGLVFILISQ